LFTAQVVCISQRGGSVIGRQAENCEDQIFGLIGDP
jgi:hypothetical protein